MTIISESDYERLELKKRIAELEAENERLLDQLKRTQGYYAEHVAMVASREAIASLDQADNQVAKKQDPTTSG